MSLYSILWERLPNPKSSSIVSIRTTFLTQQGNTVQKTHEYEEWLGVCTNTIDRVIAELSNSFPDHSIRYECLGSAKKILPYFKDRLASGKLDYHSKPFYKVYTSACHEDVGRMFRRYKVGYYQSNDWLVRVYIDLCSRHDTFSFYYKWYNVLPAKQLLDAFQMVPDCTDTPDWTIGAFDLETVPMKGPARIPDGTDSSDSIVMISLYKWNLKKGVRKWLLYLLPEKGQPLTYDRGYAYESEREMLHDFHALLADCQVLTGYNINGFDFPCLFSRLVWLNQYEILAHYSSYNVGLEVVTTFQNKLVLDLYTYFRTFSNYDLPGFKLDDVAHVKLKQAKVNVKSTGIWCWYTNPKAASYLTSDSVKECHEALTPYQVKQSQFGTFRTYLDYCLKDSELVYQLFEKEMVLSFLVERANFTTLNAVEALHLGNSRYVLELFKAYGTRLGYFFNSHFFTNNLFESKRKTYQGALNYCFAEKSYENVSVMDFTSMYPTTLLSSNLCYGTCAILTREEALSVPDGLTLIPYRLHNDENFKIDDFGPSEHFSYPKCTDEDTKVIVINEKTLAFLPCLVKHFLKLRKYHQKKWKETSDVYHYNAQQCIKLTLNSLYGTMANKDSPLFAIDIPKAIVTLSRYQLLGTYHFLKRSGYDTVYADTDSAMVHRWPDNNCNTINEYLNLPYVELKYEQRMKRLLVLGKKRYVYETEKGVMVTKGFQKKINALVSEMSDIILKAVWNVIFGIGTMDTVSLKSRGWIIWVETLLEAQYKCRDSKKYSIYRKTKHRHEYKSTTCAAVRILERYPEKANDYIEYTYGNADVSIQEASKWVVDVEDCESVNFEKLFMSQKKIFCTLLNMAYWHLARPMEECDWVLNTMHWKRFVHAELKYKMSREDKFNKDNNVTLLVDRGVRYTFKMNDHLRRSRGTCVYKGIDKKRNKKRPLLKKAKNPKRKRNVLEVNNIE